MGLFGIGDGKVDLELKDNTVSPGSMLEGTATFTLNKDIKAKGVIAILYAEETRETRMANGTSGTTRRTIYENKQQLDTAKTYATGAPLQYNFRFVIPQTGNSTNTGSGVGGILKSLAMNSMGMAITRWYIEVKLDIGLLDSVSKKQEINILAASGTPPGGIQ